MQSELQALKAALEEERIARKKAEMLLEQCTLDLNRTCNELEEVKSNIQKELERKTADVESIALFAVQYPEPLIRINYNGEAIVKNISATLLSTFEFNNKKYSQTDFWKLVATVVRRKQEEWAVEVYSDGVLYSFLCRPYPKYNYINVYGKNITQERHDQEEMRRLSLVASANENGVIFTHPDGKIFWANEGFSKLTGFSPEESIGKSPIELCKGPLSNKDALRQMVTLFQEGKSFNVEVVHYRKDGSTFWGRSSGQPILGKDGEVVQYFAMVENITIEKVQEEKLRRREEKYRSIIAGMRLGLVELDMDGIIRFVNQCYCDMSGYEPVDLVGKKISNTIFAPNDKLKIDEKLEQRKRGVTNTYEIAIQNKAGEEKWWLITGAPLYNDEGKQIGSIGVTLDITEQKLLEHSLREAKQEAERSAYAKEIFLANMSHEIRTPMNAVLGMSKQLQKTTLNKEQRFFSNTIQKAASNLLVIINDILDYSKVESGNISLEIIGFDLNELLQQAVFALSHKAQEKGILLSASIDPGVEKVVLGDPYRLNQILMNLLTNAIKFTEVGSVQLKCKVLKTEMNAQTFLIHIIDTGIGMDESFKKVLFEKFRQEDESIARRYGGTGLGMSISKQLIDIMNGEIQVESKKFEGTTVSVKLKLPTGKESDLPAQEDKVINTGILRNKRVLVAEDNELNRLVVYAVLQNYGVQITEAVNGLEAINFLQKSYFDLVLMDVQMPDMDGINATQIIRGKINKRIPIIALTANALKDELDKCLNAGMNAYLCKPFQEEELVHLMTKLIDWESEDIEFKEKEAEQPLYDLSQLHDISRGNTDFIKKMLGVFVKEVPQTVTFIKTAFLENDFKKIKALAHRIKPSIDNMGIFSIRGDVRRIEALAMEEAGGSEMETLIRKMDKVIEKVTKQVEADFL